MNEFKFRAWHKEKKKMYQVVNLELMFHCVTCCELDDETTCRWTFYFKEIELMKFTGFYDTYGKDIYVGDIVKYGKHLYRVTQELATPSLVRLDNDYIDYDDFEHSYFSNNYDGSHDEWYGQEHDYIVALYDIACNMSVIDDNLDCEIIGNIYENKEKLQDE